MGDGNDQFGRGVSTQRPLVAAQSANDQFRPRYCEHHYCRCMRAAELAAMGLIAEAVDVHSQEVRCRKR